MPSVRKGMLLESGAEPVLLLHSAVSDSGPFPADGLRRLVRELALGLAVLHARGRAYGQLSPMTVGISTGGAQLLPPTPGPLADTAGYLAPEAAAGQPIGPAADLFGLGAVTVFAGTGAGPFGTGAPLELLRRVLESEPDLSGLPDDLRDLVRQCMSKDPARRPLAAQVAVLLEPRDTAAAPPQPPPSSPEVVPVAPPEEVDEPAAAPPDAQGQKEIPDEAADAVDGHPMEDADPVRNKDSVSPPPDVRADPVDSAGVPTDQPDSAEAGESPFGPPIARLELPNQQDFPVGIPTAYPAKRSEARDEPQARRQRPTTRSGETDSGKPAPPAPKRRAKTTEPPPQSEQSNKWVAIGTMVVLVFLLVGGITVVAIVGLGRDTKESAVAPPPPSPSSSTTTTPAPPPGPPRIAMAGVTDLVAAPDGRRIYAAVRADKTVSVIDTASNTVSLVLSLPGEPDKLTISPDGAFLYVATKDAVVTIDTKADKVIGQIAGPVGQPHGIGVTPDNNRLYVSYAVNEIGTSRAWLAVLDPRAVVPAATVANAPATLSTLGTVVMAPNGRTLYAAADRATDLFTPKSHSVLVVDTTGNAVTAEIPIRAFADQLALSPDGRLLYVTHEDDAVTVIDTSRNIVVAEAKVNNVVLDVAVAPNGRYAYATGNLGFGEGFVKVIDTATNMVLETFKFPLEAAAITVTPDGRRAYVANKSGGGVVVIDISRYA